MSQNQPKNPQQKKAQNKKPFQRLDHPTLDGKEDVSNADPSSALWQWLPEWAHQAGVLLAWPHAETDWRDQLKDIQSTYLSLIYAISVVEPVFLLLPNTQELSAFEQLWTTYLSDKPKKPQAENIQTIVIAYNDTWLRDTAPLSLKPTDHKPSHHPLDHPEPLKLVSFTFNGWGGKFESSLDAALPKRLSELPQFTQWLGEQTLFEQLPYVAEGGNLENNGQGILLTQKNCLMHPNRKNQLSQTQWEQIFKEKLGIEHTLWLEHGQLVGDDTDGHIDTLARFTSPDQIVYQACDEPSYPNYESLRLMAHQLQGWKKNHPSLAIVPLPWPDPVYSQSGERLAATYTNFLIINQRVILPTYQVPQDDQALKVLQSCFPKHEIVPIVATTLIAQGGSIHCATMQIHTSCG